MLKRKHNKSILFKQILNQIKSNYNNKNNLILIIHINKH
jgi:hypothetical protein